MGNEGEFSAEGSSTYPDANVGADREKITAYVNGSPEAIRELEDWIRREIAARYPVLGAEIEDVCQAVHAKLVTNFREGRFLGRSTLRTYVASLAQHTAVDRIRRLYRDRAVFAHEAGPEEPAAPDNPYRSFQQLEEGRLLFEAVGRSPQACRELWHLVLIEKLNYEGIAKKLGIPAGTVKSRMWYCRKRMTDLLARMRGANRTR